MELERKASGLMVEGLQVFYSDNLVVKGVTMAIPAGKVTAIIGPSGCGKTTVLRTLNRMNELISGCRVEGRILLDGENVIDLDPLLLRRKVGMVFQKPNPFPMSIRENVLYGIKATGMKVERSKVVETSLRRAAIWDEVKGRLGDNAFRLSLGQQQRLCIARALALSPRVLLMDEPAASLDPTSASKVEDSIIAMKGDYTIVIITHNMQQAQRVSDYTAFMYMGELVEFGETWRMFNSPSRTATRDYVSGRFG